MSRTQGRLALWLVAALAMLFAALESPAQVRLVKDIADPFPGSSMPEFKLVDGSRTFFTATSANAGEELWVTDGTTAGTRQVADLNPGIRGTFFSTEVREPGADFVAYGGQVFWRSYGEYDFRFELWRTDGTSAGTARMLEVSTGCPGLPLGLRYAPKNWSAQRAGELYVLPGCGNQLWKIGDATGTPTRVADQPFNAIHSVNGAIIGMSQSSLYLSSEPGGEFVKAPQTFSPIGDPFATPGALLFLSDSGTTRELWSTDGTLSGTTRRTVFSTNRPTRILGSIGTLLVLDGIAGLQTLDLSNGTVTSISMSAAPQRVVSLGDRLILFSYTPSADQIWRTDGTAAGTFLVAAVSRPNAATLETFPALGGKVYFQGFDAEHGSEPWVTDGTPAGTKMLADVNPGFGNSNAMMVAAGSQLLVSVYGPEFGQDLWTLDGSTLRLLANIFDDTGSSYPFLHSSDNSHLLFDAVTLDSGRAPFASDGTGTGTQQLVNQLGPYGEHAFPLGSIGSKLYFNSGWGTVWDTFESDGTPQNTRALSSTIPSLTSARAIGAASLPGRIVLIKATTIYDYDNVISTDGTPTGTTALPIGRASGVAATFRGRALVSGGGLFSSDGTPEGTHSIAPASATQLTPVDEQLYFWGQDTAHGSELWITDGSAEGSRLVADLTPGPDFTSIGPMMPLNGKLFFFVGQSELWTSDGTLAGTHLVTIVPPLTTEDALSTGSRLLFYAKDDSGSELWQSDGTAAGTSRLADICAGPESSGNLLDGAVIDGVLYFAATDCVTGTELWMSDGTAAGTRQAHDLALGATSSSPSRFTKLQGEIYFSAYRPDVGVELFAFRPELSPSTTTLTLSSTVIALGDSIDLTAAVVPEGSETPVGSVDFVVDGDAVRNVPLSAGTASVSIGSIRGGIHQVTARYVGDSFVATSVSAPQTLSVTPRPATLTASISATEVSYGALLTIEADLSGSFASPHLPNGVVVVRDGTKLIAGRSIEGAGTSITLPALDAGAHTLLVAYERDSSFATNSVEIAVTVLRARPTISVSGLTTPIEPTAISRIYANVSGPFPVASSGILRVLDGTSVLKEFDPGVVGFGYDLGPLSLGTHEIIVDYSGDANHEPASFQMTILVRSLMELFSVSPAGVCKGQTLFNFTIDGQNFDATTLVALNSLPLSTQFVSPSRLVASNAVALPGATNSYLQLTRADGVSTSLNLPFHSSSSSPSVTAPTPLVVVATMTVDRRQSVSATTSPAFSAWLAGGSATDDCTYASPERLTPTLSGNAITATTPVFAGSTTIQFPYRDTAGHSSSSGGSLKVIPRGSLDGEFTVTAIDMVILANHLVGNIRQGNPPFTSPLEAGDLNADGKVNSVDLVILANHLVGNISNLPTH